MLRTADGGNSALFALDLIAMLIAASCLFRGLMASAWALYPKSSQVGCSLGPIDSRLEITYLPGTSWQKIHGKGLRRTGGTVRAALAQSHFSIVSSNWVPRPKVLLTDCN